MFNILKEIIEKEIKEEEVLEEEFPWREKKLLAQEVSHLFYVAGLDKQAQNMSRCSNVLDFLTDGETKKVHHVQTCKNRFCPICSARLASQNSKKLFKVLNTIFEENKSLQGIFLTLTQKNVLGKDLSSEINRLMKSFEKFCKRAKIQRVSKGWFRALEITYNHKTKEFHPHFHILLLVEDEYFHNPDLYLSGEDFSEIWQKCLGVDYHPSCKIEALKDEKGKPVYSKADKQQALIRACCEVSKYCVKTSDILSNICTEQVYKNDENEEICVFHDGKALEISAVEREKAQVLKILYTATYRRRTLGMGGLVKEVASKLKLDPTSEELEDENEDLKEEMEEKELWIESYVWDSNRKNYFLQERRAYIKEEEKEAFYKYKKKRKRKNNKNAKEKKKGKFFL